MLNEQLMSPEQKEICRLKLKIEEFKQYDAKRKKYVQKLQDDLEEYSQKYLDAKHVLDNIEGGAIIAELKGKISRQREELSRLNSIVALVPEDKLDTIQKVIDDLRQLKADETLRKNNEELGKEVERLRSANSQLASQVTRLQRKVKELETLVNNDK